MKKVVLFFTIMTIVVFSDVSYAEEQKTASNVERISQQLGITVQEATELVAEMQNLAESMGFKPKQETKTGPEIADKALEMTGKALGNISAQIEKTAPEVWRIMIKQQYANAVFWLIIPLGFAIASLIYMKWSEKWSFDGDNWDEDSKNTAEIFRFVTRLISMVVSTIWFIIALGFSIRVIINPEYYAIWNMFQIVLGLS